MILNKKFQYLTPKRVTDPVSGNRTYSLFEEKLPSVTTILKHVPDEQKRIALERWRQKVGDNEANKIRDNAAKRGTIMHRILEGAIKEEGHADLSTLGQEAGIMAQAVLDNGFLEDLQEVYGMEMMLGYEGLYAGAADVVGVYKDRECIIDFKQSNNPKKLHHCRDYFNQAAAYAMAHNDMYGTKIGAGVILVSVHGGGIQEFVLKDKEFQQYCWNWLRKVDEYYRLFK